MIADSNPELLQSLRAELDAVDEKLLLLLRDRIDCCIRIAHVKREHGVAMMQPQRIGVVQQRAAAFAARHELNPDFLRELYDLIIAETCRVEDLVIGAVNAQR